LAFAGLADCYALLNSYGGLQLEEFPLRAKAAAEQTLAEAHTTKAYVKFNYDPISPIITAQQGLPYFYMRQYDQALEEFNRAMDLEPNFTPAVFVLTSCYSPRLLKNGTSISQCSRSIRREAGPSRGEHLPAYSPDFIPIDRIAILAS